MNDMKIPSGDTAGPPSSEDEAPSPELLAYLGSMAADLHLMAKRSGLTVIAALLNLVRVEAELNGGSRRKRHRAS